MDDDIVMLKRGDPCPLCGQPIQTDDEVALTSLTMLQEYLESAKIAGAALSHLRPDPETGGGCA